jgi:hypothetical protein
MVSVSGFVKNQSTGEVKKTLQFLNPTQELGTITNNEGYYRLLLSPESKSSKFQVLIFIHTSTF